MNGTRSRDEGDGERCVCCGGYPTTSMCDTLGQHSLIPVYEHRGCCLPQSKSVAETLHAMTV